MQSSIAAESDALSLLLRTVDKDPFKSSIYRLNSLFNIYAGTCPAPLPSSGLILTPEIRAQCEQYLPISGISSIFNHLYSAALSYQPILSSTPFHNAMSWADVFAALPSQFQFSANPARLLEALLDDRDLLTRFLFASFQPERFYGGRARYPEQHGYIRHWLGMKKSVPLKCLDAACGTGDETYALALLLSAGGFRTENVLIDGWTLDPLEVWSATYRRFPHNRRRERTLRDATSTLMQEGYNRRISFCCGDILALDSSPTFKSDTGHFDLILCNGLLGGPILHENKELEVAIRNLARVLAPGGILLAADNFHGGWKQKCPQSELRALFEKNGLKTFDAGEGIGGLKADQ